MGLTTRKMPRNQEILGIFSTVAITSIAILFGISETMDSENIVQNQNIEIIEIGGITEVKESIKISFDSQTMDLDSSDGLFRANLIYEGFQPQMGRVMLEVYSPTGEKFKESEIQLRQRGNDVYEADFIQYFDKNEFNENALGQYIMRVSTDYGTLAKQVPFNISMSSIEPPKQILAVKSNVQPNVE